MKAAALILTLAGCLAPCLASAQSANDCAACVSAAACDTRQDLCVAECRARLFDIIEAERLPGRLRDEGKPMQSERQDCMPRTNQCR